MWSFPYFLKSALLGVALAMDAFSVSLANGLAERQMKARKGVAIAGTFAFFQALMPLIGWFFVHTAVTYFKAVQPFIPWAALLLLGAIGGKMIFDGAKTTECEVTRVTGVGGILVQGIATSIDALSTGFTIASYDFPHALVSALVIAAVTFFICGAGVAIGTKFGKCFQGKATLVGGIILIAIGLQVFLKGIL